MESTESPLPAHDGEGSLHVDVVRRKTEPSCCRKRHTHGLSMIAAVLPLIGSASPWNPVVYSMFFFLSRIVQTFKREHVNVETQKPISGKRVERLET